MATLARSGSLLPVLKGLVTRVVPGLGFVGLLYLVSRYNFLLYHTVAELFSISVAAAVFMLVWNTRRFMSNDFLFLTGVSYLFVAIIDLFHTLAYKGMGIFPGDDANLPTQLWIAARYLQSLSFLAAVLLVRRRVNQQGLLVVLTLVTLFLLAAIAGGIFPDSYVNGLTPFKKVSEYVISLILAVAGLRLWRERRAFSPRIASLIIASLVFTILAELTFTFYTDVYGVLNFLGHIFKIVAVYYLYKAVIETGLKQPLELLFHDMKQRELELEESQKMLKEIATHDPLTGLPNRLLFDARLTHALEECRRENYDGLKSMVQVIIMDMDNFKTINDLFGHLVGDEVLKEIGQRLKAEIRASDTVARWGGDEFTCVLESVASIDDARHTAEKILTAVTEPMLIRGQKLHVKVSLGFSLYPIHGEDSETLLRNADAALYRAKATKDTYQMYNERRNVLNTTFPPSTTVNQ